MLGQGLAPATVNRRLTILRRLLNLAYQWGWTEQPLAPRVKLLRVQNERHLYLTPREVAMLAAAAREAAEHILLLAYTGMRVGELWLAQKRDGCAILPATTKSGRPRIIPLPSQVTRASLPPKITRSQLRKRFEMARAAIGRPEIRLHDLRHSYASCLVQTGARLPAVRDLLGHSDLSVTGRYSHLAPSHLRDAVKKTGAQCSIRFGWRRKPSA